MLTAMEIENFKGIGRPVRIEFRPLTLLFGPNSAGKSSFFHALQYAEEILERNNFNTDRTRRGGSAVDLGGFQSLVHNHDLDRAVRLRFDFTPSTTSLPEFEDWFEPELAHFNEGLGGLIRSAWVEWSLRWSRQFNFPLVERYSVGANGQRIASLRSAGDSPQVWLHEIGLDHPLIAYDGRATNAASAEPAVDEGVIQSELPCSTGGLWALPDWDGPLDFGHFDDDDLGSPMIGRISRREFETRISTLLVGIGRMLKRELQRQRYVGPLREPPSRDHVALRFPNEERWANGLAAWDYLMRLRGGTDLDNLNEWLARLKTGYAIQALSYKEVPLTSRMAVALGSSEQTLDDIESLPQAFRDLPTATRVLLLDVARQVPVRPPDVGVGVSQLLPVLLSVRASLEGEPATLVAIEQPELHVHPAIQVELGDFFAAEIGRNAERVLLLETHSEHLILRLRRRIEETGSGELPPGAPPLRPDQLAVIYVQPVDGDVRAHHLRLDERGEFLDRWPQGFFEERSDELF